MSCLGKAPANPNNIRLVASRNLGSFHKTEETNNADHRVLDSGPDPSHA
jgi:hypothetical protein